MAIRLEDGGPVFYTQERVGRGGRLFRSLKFRSMRDGGEDFRQAREDDPRITRVGHLLRATALDELPQLVNILRGEMSFVGPRALLPREEQVMDGEERMVELRELPGFEERHSVRPGLTGLAQTRASRDLPHRKKFRYDLLYVRRRSLGLDLRLVAESVLISLRGGWHRVGRERREAGAAGTGAAGAPGAPPGAGEGDAAARVAADGDGAGVTEAAPDRAAPEAPEAAEAS